MAGKRQHYIPQLLQRGFLYDDGERGERTWLHRRHEEPRLISIRDIGVEPWFYSRRPRAGELTLDDEITRLERDLSKRIDIFRNNSRGDAVDSIDAATIVIHLVMRTAAIRKTISNGISTVVDEISALFTDPTRLGSMLGLQDTSLAPSVMAAIQERIGELEPLGIPISISERIAPYAFREYGSVLIKQACAALAPTLSHLSSELKGRGRDAHNSMLQKPVEDLGWVKELASFSWTVESGQNFILPDAVALVLETGSLSLKNLLFTQSSDVEVVLMPISKSQILVGRRVSDQAVDLSAFNEEAASRSDSFFICAKPYHDSNLSTKIGTAHANEIQRAISTAVNDATKNRRTRDREFEPVSPKDIAMDDFSFTLRLADFGDISLAQEFAKALYIIMSSASKTIPLQDLDGVTIAIDYEKAISEVDRGDPKLPRLATGALGYGIGVAMPINVMRGSRMKQHIVIAESLAESWLSPDSAIQSAGIHRFAKALAGVAHASRYSEALNRSFRPDPARRELHAVVATCPAGYWSARHAAYLAPDQGNLDADLVIESLRFVRQSLGHERDRIAELGHISDFTARASEGVSAVLMHAADWLGHRDGLPEGSSFSGNDLPDRLREYGLSHWVELFGRDLAACYNFDDAIDLDVATGLSSHVERLFWTFGLYCWPENEDLYCLVNEHFYHPSIPEL